MKIYIICNNFDITYLCFCILIFLRLRIIFLCILRILWIFSICFISILLRIRFRVTVGILWLILISLSVRIFCWLLFLLSILILCCLSSACPSGFSAVFSSACTSGFSTGCSGTGTSVSLSVKSASSLFPSVCPTSPASS